MRLCTIWVSSGRRSHCSLSNVSDTDKRMSIQYLTAIWSDYSKLPPVPTVDTVFLLDPLIATGGTACAAMHMILDWGIPGKWPSSDAVR